jgi:sigma-B regulation protein RsbU (phosphoserine phosphatase)
MPRLSAPSPRAGEFGSKEQRVNVSIKTRIVLAIGLPLLIVWLGLTWCEYRIGHREALADMESHLAELTTRQAAELDIELSKTRQVANTLASVISMSPDVSEQQIKDWLQETLQANPEAFGLGVTFEPSTGPHVGRLFAPYYYRDGASKLSYMNLADAISRPPYREWCEVTKNENRPAWSEPYFDEETGSPVMCTYGMPYSRNGKFHGVVIVDVLSKHLLDDILSVKGGEEYCTLISRKGVFISHPDASRIMQQAEFQEVGDRDPSKGAGGARGPMLGGTGVFRIVDDRSGLRSWMVCAPVRSTGWTLAAIIPEQEVLAPIHARLARSLAVFGVACLLMMGVIWLVSTKVSRPINRLTEAAESLADGNLDTRVPDAKGTDEVARLTRTFNTMVANLKSNIEGRIREEAARKEVEGELCAARKIQAALLPETLPDEAERPFSLHAINDPAKTVAGDFYDFLYLDDRTLGLVMADVSGKGIPAAIYMAVTRTLLRHSLSPNSAPSEVITQLNQRLASKNQDAMFVTLCGGYYDMESGEFTYVNAGHNPPYVVREDGRLETLDPTGPLVGPFADAVFGERRCRLEPRDLLVFFTDGVTEAASPSGEYFGEPRLEAILRSHAAKSATQVCEAIREAVQDFTAGDLSDDVTILVLERTCVGAKSSKEAISPVGIGCDS